MNRGELLRRYVFFIVGLFVNSLGIALITKGDLGTSPISSIPYTLSIGFTPSLGMFTLYYSLLLVGCVVLGIGVFMEMAANVVMLPGECTVKAISTTWNTDFGKTKVAVDVTMAASAAVLGLILYQELTGVREGTFVSALLVGAIARTVHRWINPRVQTLLTCTPAPVEQEAK